MTDGMGVEWRLKKKNKKFPEEKKAAEEADKKENKEKE